MAGIAIGLQRYRTIRRTLSWQKWLGSIGRSVTPIRRYSTFQRNSELFCPDPACTCNACQTAGREHPLS